MNLETLHQKLVTYCMVTNIVKKNNNKERERGRALIPQQKAQNHSAKLKESVTKDHILYDPIVTKCLEQANEYGQNKLVVAYSWRG